MLKVQEIREIIKLIDHSSIDEFIYESEGTKVKLKKNGVHVSTETVVPQSKPAAPAVEAPVAVEVNPTPVAQTVKETIANVETKESAVNDESLLKISSPMVGTFYQSSSPDTPAYVQVGDKVTEDGIVCIVEAMKLFNEIEAEVSGEIVEILVKDGQLVEYGQPLFLVKAN
ncbi:acetyl-CoA carboxylase biotin carboxyl carrier protein [Paenisporosarcina sp. FSL H8-0542]|uniref:acetyl-CoA carboxylase biotin carboxyl carrier protein n=1 Tax=unclassified Paenisporosarcina TaxID=2642018 RepID=UPI00034E41E5|nr:acetyl-CoA carboxylase biotin carboxyl carrier protein [Paenisporosarcina sp. HGH0030]EPD53628.1 acetyl-CoA carboxylase, biotin carboxyl carrier protein [Paenisporosarcina sp. HGH0030]